MGRRLGNPSSRGYATPSMNTTPLTARETFGGESKAGLGRHIGMGRFTYKAVVNGSSGHKAPPLAGNSFLAAYRAGYMTSPEYPINKTNQLSRVGAGTTGGMTRTPADGVNLEQREMMQTRVDKWNKVWPAMPIRDTPNNCCKSVPDCKCLNDSNLNLTSNGNLDLTNFFIIWFDENNLGNGLYFSVTQKVYWRTGGNPAVPINDYFLGNNYTITDQNNIKFTTSDNTSYTFIFETNNDNNIISITKIMTKMGNITQNIYDVADTYIIPPIYLIIAINGNDGANIAWTIKDTHDEAENTIITNLDPTHTTKISEYSKNYGNIIELHICNVNVWIYPEQILPTTHYYSIEALGPLNILLGGTDANGNIIEPSLNPCNNINNGDDNVEGGGSLPNLENLLVEWNDNYGKNFLYFYYDYNKIYWQTSSNDITDNEKAFGMKYSINKETNTITITSSNSNTIEFIFNTQLDDNSIISITKKITINNESNSDTYNISLSSYKIPEYTINQVNGKDDAGLDNIIYESYQNALNDILDIMEDDYNSFTGNLGVNQLNFCGQQQWESNTKNNMYTILYVLHTDMGKIIIAGTDNETILIQPSLEACS